MSTTGWIVIAIIVVVVIFLIMIYNRLVGLNQRTGQAWSDISVQLKQRHDLVPNLVETVKGYAAHERGTLEAVVQARNAAVAASGPAAQAQAENMLSGALRQLFALVRGLPQPQGQRQFPRPAGPADRHREQDRRRAPLLQQRRLRVQRLDPAVPGRHSRRPARFPRARLLRARRGRARRGERGAAGEILSRPALRN